MFTSTRGCAGPMLPFSRLKVKVTLKGKKMTKKIFLNFNMYLSQLCEGHWWGYESHLAIVLVVFDNYFIENSTV